MWLSGRMIRKHSSFTITLPQDTLWWPWIISISLIYFPSSFSGIKETCHAYRLKGYKTSYTYLIDPDGRVGEYFPAKRFVALSHELNCYCNSSNGVVQSNCRLRFGRIKFNFWRRSPKSKTYQFNFLYCLLFLNPSYRPI